MIRTDKVKLHRAVEALIANINSGHCSSEVRIGTVNGMPLSIRLHDAATKAPLPLVVGFDAVQETKPNNHV